MSTDFFYRNLLTRSCFLLSLSERLAPTLKDILGSLYLLSFMENLAFFITFFFLFVLVSITGYSIYMGFGPPSKQLRDPFEEHED